MLYNSYDLVLYFYIYAFIGWALYTMVIYVRTGKLSHRGILNEPLIIKYGLIMNALIIGSGLSQTNVVNEFIVNYFRVFLFVGIGDFITRHLLGHSMNKVAREKFLKNSVRMMASLGEKTDKKESQQADKADLKEAGKESRQAEKKGEKESPLEYLEHNKALKDMVVNLVIATVSFSMFKIVHPFLFMAVSLIPRTAVEMVAIILAIMVLADVFMVLYTAGNLKKLPVAEELEELMAQNRMTMAYRLTDSFRQRMQKTYPELKKYEDQYSGIEDADAIARRKGIIFAKGMCLNKLIWVFLITSLLGDGIETLYVHLVSGVWMRRSGVVFGPFSIVWGVGAAMLSMILYRFAENKKYQIFLGGFFLGGAYEYTASVVLETLFHTKFWDYSKIPLNIGGRTNVPFMVGWGVLSLVWICLCYPVMSKFIEKFPPFAGLVITWGLMVFMCLDLAMTGAVMLRYNERKSDLKASNALEEYIDKYYTDSEVEEMWPNLTSTVKKAQTSSTK